MEHIKKYIDFLNEGRVPKSERIKIIEDNRYLLVAPLTNRASAKYGAFTNWCTAVPYSGASIEDMKVNQKGCGKMLYLINKEYKPDNLILREMYDMKDKYDNAEIDDSEYFEFIEKNEPKCFDLSKIAFENGEHVNFAECYIWSANNIEMTEYNYTLDDLELDDYVVEAIREYMK